MAEFWALIVTKSSLICLAIVRQLFKVIFVQHLRLKSLSCLDLTFFTHEPLSSINLMEVCYWNINDMTHPWRFEDDKTRTVRSELEREFFVKLPPRLSFKLMKKTNKICCGTLFGDNQFLRKNSSAQYDMIATTDYGHTKAKFIIPQIQIPIPNEYLGCGYKGLVFCSNNGWLMENMD